MIKTLTAYTTEIDDVDIAVKEILEQLNIEDCLLKNSVGILSCYSEFIDTGVVKSLCEKLPFDVVGVTTLACAVSEQYNETMLSVMVITSDDVSFVSGITDDITAGDNTVFEKAYATAVGKCCENPRFMLSFVPMTLEVSAETVIKTMDEITCNLPNFGTLAVDHTSDYHTSQTIYNGEAYYGRYVFLLFCGNISPRFFVASISNENILREKGVVTASHGNLMQTVNNISVTEYLHSLGLQKDDNGSIIGINSFPFVVDYNDGTTPVVRVMFNFAPDGSAVCGGDIPVGTTLSVGRIDANEVLNTSKQILEDVLSGGSLNGLLMFSCVGRYFAQGFDQTAEMRLVQQVLAGKDVPYQLIYSGSELCPVYNKTETAVNRNHNDTLVICAF